MKVEPGKPSYRSPHRLVDPEEQEHQGKDPDHDRPAMMSAFNRGTSDAK